jgi:hypothetical protein
MNNNSMRGGMEHRRDSMMRGEMRQRPDSLHLRGMGPRMNQDMRSRAMHGMNPYFMPGRRNMGPWNRAGMRPGRGMGWSIDALPDITEKQKEEISKIRQKQQVEMKKLRDEMSEKMNHMRESHRKAIMNQLSDEQKKVFESRSGRVASPPVPAPEKKK